MTEEKKVSDLWQTLLDMPLADLESMFFQGLIGFLFATAAILLIVLFAGRRK